MKKMKKIMAMLLAMVMVLGMTVTAMAAGETILPLPGRPSENDKGIITVANVEQDSTVKAYQVVKAKYDNLSKEFTGYEAIKVDGKEVVENIENPTAEEINAIKTAIEEEKLNSLLIELKYDNDSGKYKTVDDEGNANAPVGSYVILINAPSNSTTVYSPLYGSVAYGTTNEGDGNTLEQGNIDVMLSSNLYSKKQEGPIPEKNIVEENDKSKESVTIGSVVKFELKATLPDYKGYENPIFKFVDTLSTGLTYNADTYKVFVGTGEVDASNVQEEENGQTVTFSLTPQFIKENLGKEVKITYTATVNENATSGFDANTNTVKLDYSNSPTTVTSSEEKKTYNYTFDINGLLTKVDSDNIETKLDRAKFALYTDEDCKVRATYADDNTTPIPEAETTKDGNIEFEKLNEGTYYLKETVAPEDYQLSGKVYKIVIGANYDTDGKMTDYKITITDMDTMQEVENTYYENENNITVTNVKNTKLSSLPSTGGIGTTIFTIGGCAIMVAAAGLFFASRRKANK